MNQRRSLKELNLLDKFLFDEAMDDPENVKTILDIILSQNTKSEYNAKISTTDRERTENIYGQPADPAGCLCYGRR